MKKLSVLLIALLLMLMLTPALAETAVTPPAEETTIFGIVAMIDGAYVVLQLSDGMFPFHIDPTIVTLPDEDPDATEGAFDTTAIGEILKVTFAGDHYNDIPLITAAELFAPDAIGIVTEIKANSIVITEEDGAIELTTDGAAILSDHGIIVGDIVEVYGDDGIAHAINVDTSLVNGLVTQLTDKTMTIKFGSRDLMFETEDVDFYGAIAEGKYASVLYIGNLANFYAVTAVVGDMSPEANSAALLIPEGKLTFMTNNLLAVGQMQKLATAAKVKTYTVVGLITDGTNAGFTIVTKAGRYYHIKKDNATRVSGPGMTIGNKATVKYTGSLTHRTAKAKTIKTAYYNPQPYPVPTPTPQPTPNPYVQRTAYGYVNATFTNGIQITVGSSDNVIFANVNPNNYNFGDYVSITYVGYLSTENIIAVRTLYAKDAKTITSND